MPLLKIVAEVADIVRLSAQDPDGQPFVTKLDVTRDLAGSFFAVSDWRERHRELACALHYLFDTPFRDNGNSFDSCFQFVDRNPDGHLEIRIKYYWKNLALF